MYAHPMKSWISIWKSVADEGVNRDRVEELAKKERGEKLTAWEDKYLTDALAFRRGVEFVCRSIGDDGIAELRLPRAIAEAFSKLFEIEDLLADTANETTTAEEAHRAAWDAMDAAEAAKKVLATALRSCDIEPPKKGFQG